MQKREEALECLKACVLALKNQGEEMQSDPNILMRWQDKVTKATKMLESLTKEDRIWFEKQWGPWLENRFGKEIEEIRLKFG